MKRYILATLSALSLMIAPFAARAQDPQTDPSKSGQQGQIGSEKGTQPSQGMQGQQMGGFKGRHVMQGEVTKLDKQASEVTIRTLEGEDLTLHFPASALTNLNEGDRVSVELALRPEKAQGSDQGIKQQPKGTTPQGTQKPGGMGGDTENR